jgi:hypothetical protein
MVFRKSKATKAREAVSEQVSDRTDDLMAALDAAKEALSRASAAAGRKGAELGAELGKEASKAADKLMPERARQRRREAGRKRRRRLLAGAAGLVGVGLLAGRLAGSKGGGRQDLKRRTDQTGGWDRPAEPAQDAGAAPPAEVTPLHQGNGASTDPARTPPS